MKQQLIIDQGHDPKFPGASGVKPEVTWVRTIGGLLVQELAAFSASLDVTVVPDGLGGANGNGNLVNKINWINKNARAGALLISLHGDGATNPNARGITVCYYTGSTLSQNLGKQLLSFVLNATKVPAFGGGLMGDMSGRFGRLGMIRDTKPLALLVENGFVSNAADMAVDPSLYAHGIAQFVRSYFKL